MWVLIWLGLPFIVGALVGATFVRGLRSTSAGVILGLLIGFGVVLWAYYSSPTTYDGCECNLILGRWWEPAFVIFIVAIGYFFWLLGIGAGVGVRSLVRRARDAAESRK